MTFKFLSINNIQRGWLLVASAVLLLNVACNNHRMVVPYDIDTDEVFKAVEPNEDDSPDNPTFGENRIPGFIFDYDMTTESSDVYVFFENLTILDVNPDITSSIFDFISEEMQEYGFISPEFKDSLPSYKSLIESGMNYTDAAATLLDKLKNNFDSKSGEILSYSSPFNLYFQIYPVSLTSDYVTYRESAYCYTGGAHGIQISNLKTYSLADGHRLTLQDIVKPEDMDDVRLEVVARMAYAYPIYENITSVDQYIDSLNVWLDNFDPEESTQQITLQNYPLSDPALTNEGLAFIYQMYELTPGSDGCPLVVIPYKDIEGCLKINPR